MENPAATRFEFKDFIKSFGLSILLFIFFSGLISVIPGVGAYLDGAPPVVSFVIQYLIQFVILFFPLWIFVFNKYAASVRDFGFTKVNFWKMTKVALLAYISYLLLSFLISIIFYYVGDLPGYQAQESYIPLFGENMLGFVVAIFFISIVAPFLEEFFFRGFIYRIFTKTWPVWLASIVTAALFASIHFQLQSFIPLFILGLILNYTYHKTGSVWTSVLFHSLNNTIAFGVDIYLYFHPELLQNLEAISGFVV